MTGPTVNPFRDPAPELDEDTFDRLITEGQEAARALARHRPNALSMPATPPRPKRPRTPPADLYTEEVRVGGVGYLWRVRDAAGEVVAEGEAWCRGDADTTAAEVVAHLTLRDVRAQLRAMHRRAQRAESEVASWRRRAIRGENDAVYWRNRWIESEEERKAPTVRMVPLDLVTERDAALARVRELEAENAKARAYIGKLKLLIDAYRARDAIVDSLGPAARPAPNWRNLWGLL